MVNPNARIDTKTLQRILQAVWIFGILHGALLVAILLAVHR
jgi:hypothetical protein